MEKIESIKTAVIIALARNLDRLAIIVYSQFSAQ
jgi:hypothetical protein